MRKARTRRGVVSAALVATGLAVAAGLTVGGSTPASSQSNVVTTPAASLVNELAVLRRPRTSDDALPASVASTLDERHPAPAVEKALVAAGEDDTVRDRLPESGANAALSRLARRSPSGMPMYVIPSQEGLCVLTVGGSQRGCVTAEAIEGGETTEAVLCEPGALPANEIEISGILPDGVTQSVVMLSNGETAPLNVIGNVYVANFPRSGPLPVAIDWMANGTRHSADAHVPAGVSTEHCASEGS